MDVFSRSWKLTQLSFKVIWDDKELLLFPIFSALFSLAVLGLFWLPLDYLLGQQTRMGWSYVVLFFLLYLVLTIGSTFFSVCAVHIIKKRLEGGREGLSESVAFAWSKIDLILSWSLLAATVSTLLRLLEGLVRERETANPLSFISNLLGEMLVGGLKMAWSVVTLFVIPAMVYKGLGPIDAIKDSIAAIKNTWGESLIRSTGLGLVQIMVLVGGVASLIFLGMVFSTVHPGLILVLFAIGVIYIASVSAVFSVANTVFNTALYAYAVTGQVPEGYDSDLLNGAFRQKN